MFGLEPHFGCCTSNFNQAWPKLTLSSFMHNGSTVLSAIPIPSSIKTNDFCITLESNYPFENKLKYIINANKDIQLKVRIPSFAKNLTVNGKPSSEHGELSFSFASGENAVINIEFETVPEIVKRPHGLNAVSCGSLVFSLPIAYAKKMYEYEKRGIERKYPYCDYEYIPKSEWSYAYSSEEFVKEGRGVFDIPFSSENPPVVLKARVKRIAWGYEDGFDTVCAKIPESTEPISDEEEILLYPYGSAKLRMTELPII